MNRRIFMFCALLALATLLASPPSAALFWECKARRERPPDCGKFPYDRNIMVIPPGGEGVVARYRWQGGYRTMRPRREGESGSRWRGLRVFNNLDRPLPIFLRTREEFNAFKEYARKEPGISTCSVVDGTMFLEGCLDANGEMLPACPKHEGTYVVRHFYRCYGVRWDCGGRCWGLPKGRTVKVLSALVTRGPPRRR